MADDYTPTDGEILTAVVLYRAISAADAPPPTIDTIATPEETARYLGEYQRWLAEHDAKVRAEAIRDLRADYEFFAVGKDGESDGYYRGVSDGADELFLLMDAAADNIEKEAGL